jgi:sugar-specific transcriptional regulator TrmB
MSNISDLVLKNYFEKLGLGNEEYQIYSTLLRIGRMSVLQIAKETNISRTNTYRLLEKLVIKGVVEELLDNKHKVYEAGDVSTLDLLIKHKEVELDYLHKYLPQVSQFLQGNKNIDQPGTKVVFYRGVEGIKQLAWNVIQTKTEWVAYTSSSFKKIVGEKYDKKFAEELKLRKVQWRELISDGYFESLDKTSSDEADDLYGFAHPGQAFVRYIPKETLDITHVSDIFDDVVSFQSWYNGDIYGVEIYNKELNRTQRQLFEIVWQIALPYNGYDGWLKYRNTKSSQ